MVLFSVFIPQLSQKCVKRLHQRLRNKFIRLWGRTDRIDLKPHLCSNLKSLSASFCVGFGIFEGVLAVLALSIFPVDLILLSSFLSIDLSKKKSMSLHSLYSTPFIEVGKSQLGLFLCHSLLVPYCTIASFENNNVAMWEQASPSPAIHVQQELYHQAPQ